MNLQGQKQNRRLSFQRAQKKISVQPLKSSRFGMEKQDRQIKQRSQEIDRVDKDLYIQNLQNQNENLFLEVKKLKKDNFSLMFKKNEADIQKRKIKELKTQLDSLSKNSKQNYNLSIRSSFQSDNNQGSTSIQQLQYDQCLAILKIKSFDSAQDSRIYKSFQTLLNFYNDSHNNDKQKIDKKKQELSSFNFCIIAKTGKNCVNKKQNNLLKIDSQNLSPELEQLYKSLNNNKSFDEQKYLKKLFYKFGINFSNYDREKFNKKTQQIVNFIIKQDNTTFEIKRLFSKVLKKQPNKNLSNIDMIKLIQKSFMIQRKESLLSTDRASLNKRSSIERQKSIDKIKLQNMTFQQETLALREEINQYREQMQTKIKEIDDEKQINQILRNQLDELNKQNDEFTDTIKKLQEQIRQNLQNENMLQNENQFFKKKFSIISSVRNEFPQSRLSMISQEFFDDEIFDSFPRKRKQRNRTSILMKDLSQEMFQEAQKTANIQNFKDFLMSQVQKEKNSISAHLTKSDNQLDSIKENSMEILTDSEFDDKKEKEQQKKLQKKQIITKMKKQIEQMQNSQQQILQSLENKIQEKQEQEKEIQILLQQIEDQQQEADKTNKIVQQYKKQNKLVSENLQSLTQKNEILTKEVLRLKHFNNNLRIQNLEMIKLRAWKEKILLDIERKNSLDRVQKNMKHWGTQTQRKQKLEMSVDFQLLKCKSSNNKNIQPTKTLRRDDSIKLFQNYSLFQKKVAEYKQTIQKLQDQKKHKILEKNQFNFSDFFKFLIREYEIFLMPNKYQLNLK